MPMPLSFTSRPGAKRTPYARRTGRPWLSHEIEALLLLLHARTSMRVIALRLGRTEEAVRRMAGRLIGSVAMRDPATSGQHDAPNVET